MRRVAIFTTAYWPLVGGAEVAVQEITKRLTDFHFDIYTARLRRDLPAVESINNVTIHRLGYGWSLIDKLLLAFRGHRYAQVNNSQEAYDLIWGVMASFGGLAARNFKLHSPGIPFLLTLQEGDDLDVVEIKGKILGPAFRDIFGRADRVQVISSYLAEWARKMGAQSQIEVIPNGVDLSLFKFRSNEPVNHPRCVITTSRLVTKNGVGNLIKALPLVRVPVRLEVVGDGPLMRKLRFLTYQLKVSDQVNFAGVVPHNQLPDLLSQSDVFTRPSLSEGLGNSFLEAMAIGVPVVGTRVGGIPDFLQHGQTGWLVEPGNHRQLAETIDYVLDARHQKEVRQVIKNARQLVEKKYDWDTIALQFRLLLNRMQEL